MLRACGTAATSRTTQSHRPALGVDDQLLAQVHEHPDALGLSERHRTILTATDELLGSQDISDVAWSALGHEFDGRQMIEFVLLVDQYDGLATTIEILRAQRDF
ncbi:MAG: hypothetical protein WBQ44_17425 [Rhodococcus sp. (in: high G+C Gram-positive bacteria)]